MYNNNSIPIILTTSVPQVTGQIGFIMGNIRPIVSNQLSVLLSTTSNKNNIRKFLYNICLSMPQVFDNLVNLICYTGIPCVVNNSNNPQAIVQHMTLLVDKVSAAIAAERPDLINIQITDQDRSNAVMASNEIYGLINQTNNFLSRVNNTTYAQPNMYQQPAQQIMYNNVQQPMPVQQPQYIRTQVNTINEATGNDRYANRVQNTQPMNQVPQIPLQQNVEPLPVQAQTPIQNNGETIVTEDDWVPTINNPYKTLITNKQSKYYIIKDGVVFERIKQIKGITPVDREAHMLVKSGTDYNQAHVENKIESLSSQTFDIVKALKLQESKEPEEANAAKLLLKSVIDDNVSLNINIEEGIMDARISYLMLNKKSKSTFYTKEIYVANIHPSLIDMGYFIDALTKAHTYSSLANIVSREIDEISESQDSDDNKIDKLMFTDKVNRVLTEKINDFLLLGLGSSIRIGSLTEDASSIEPFITETLGQTYSSSYLRWEEDTLPGVFKMVDGELYNSLKDGLFGNNENKDLIKLNPLLEKYTVTFINLQLSETGFVLNNNTPYNITRNNTRYLYNIATILYKNPNTIHHKHLLVTSDNVVLRIYKSYMSHDLYVAALIK